MEAEDTAHAAPASDAPSLRVVDGGLADAGPLTWLVGISSYSVFAWLYDYPLYAAVLWHLGPWWGGLVMTLLTIPIDVMCLRIYDWTQKDWLAIEYLKSTKSYQGGNILKKTLGFLLRETPVPVQIILLSPKFNAFIITALVRDQSNVFRGLSSRDWMVFAFSFLTTQIYWIMTVYLGLCGVEFLLS